jgi:hypothetical protein
VYLVVVADNGRDETPVERLGIVALPAADAEVRGRRASAALVHRELTVWSRPRLTGDTYTRSRLVETTDRNS